MSQQDPQHKISQFLKDNGSIHATGNYASVAVQFRFDPIANRTAYIHDMHATIRDSGAFDAEDYGNKIALTNGVRFVIRDSEDALVHALDGGEPIKSNAEWARLGAHAEVHSWGTGDEFLHVDWHFALEHAAIELTGGNYLAVELNDDFTALVDHTFFVQGEYR